MDMTTNLEKFWDTCDENFAHIKLGRHLKGYDDITQYWEDRFISNLEWDNKSVLEYGIGAAYLGKYLFENKNISKYYGVDISKRSLDAAEDTLEGNYELFTTDEFYNNFKDTCDIFVTQACIQHFPNLEYLETFLSKLEKLQCKEMILQIRYSDDDLFIGDMEDYQESDIVFACRINNETITKNLPSYELVSKSDIEPNKYQFLHYKLK